MLDIHHDSNNQCTKHQFLALHSKQEKPSKHIIRYVLQH